MKIINTWKQFDMYNADEPIVGVMWENADGSCHRVEVRLENGELPLQRLQQIPLGVIEAMHAEVKTKV